MKKWVKKWGLYGGSVVVFNGERMKLCANCGEKMKVLWKLELLIRWVNS